MKNFEEIIKNKTLIIRKKLQKMKEILERLSQIKLLQIKLFNKIKLQLTIFTKRYNF